MKQLILRTMAVALVLGALPSIGVAHTVVVSTSPKSGAVLEHSPPVIEIKFRDQARLTSVVVVEAGKAERRLEFAPKSSATSFKLPNPELLPGRNEIQWKALSHDGHVISGSLILVIKPVSAPASTAATPKTA